MKKLLALLLLLTAPAYAGQTPPPGTNGQIIFNNNGLWGAETTIPSGNLPTITLSGDTTGSGTTAITTTTGKVNGVTYGTSPSTNTVPVVTGSNTVTYEAVPNAALANSAIIFGATSQALGSTITNLNAVNLGPSTAGTGAFTTLSASSTLTSNVTGGGTQCLHASNTGVVSGTGSDCVSGGGGTITLGTSASATNPQRTSEAGTGFYSLNSGEIDGASAGTILFELDPSSENEGVYLGYNYNHSFGSYSVGIGGEVSVGQAFIVAIGQSAKANGEYDTVVGQYAGDNGGGYNTIIGGIAGNRGVLTGSNNTFVGATVGHATTTAANNTIIGYNVASGTLTTGASNILIGTSSAVTTVSSSTSNNLNIGNLLQGDMTNSTALGTEALFLQSTSSSVDYIKMTSGVTGSPGSATISVGGSDTNANMVLTPLGSGDIKVSATTGAQAMDLSASTNSIILPSGTSAQRPSPANGMLRYNSSSTGSIEAYYNSAWNTLGSGGGSGITALTGDVTASGSGSVAATVAKIAGVAVGTPTGTTNVVFSNSPTLVTPTLGVASATSLSVTGNSAPSGEGIYSATTNGAVGFASNGAAVGQIDKNGVPEFTSSSRVTSTFSKTSSTALSAITGLSATLVAGKTYNITGMLYTSNTSGAGGKVDFNGGSATATAFVCDGWNGTSTATVSNGQITALSSLATSWTTSAGVTVYFDCLITVNAGGTFIPEFAQNVSNATASTVIIGSHMLAQQIP